MRCKNKLEYMVEINVLRFRVFGVVDFYKGNQKWELWE